MNTTGLFRLRHLPIAATAALLLAGCSDVSVSPVASEALVGAVPASRSPLEGVRFYVDGSSRPKRQAEAWRMSRPADAALMELIAAQPQAVWLGEWTPGPRSWVRDLTSRVRAAGTIPILVVYNIPNRDCGQWSAGGLPTTAAYLDWVREVTQGMGTGPAVVILEPDGLALMNCLSEEGRQDRLQAIRAAVGMLKAQGATVYIDAGNGRWLPAEEVADRLKAAGIAEADGFALNVSNFVTTADNIRFGEDVSRLVGGKHFVIDTSRNGLGPTPTYEWCNPPGRALGAAPTTQTGHPLVDAFLWIKAPGESDGKCNGGPSAGSWWPEYALGLAARAR